MSTARILCIGVNHETAPLAVREAFAGTPPVKDPLLGKQCPHLDEWVLLSTCNRVEIYAAVSGEPPLEAPRDLLLGHFGIPAAQLGPHMAAYQGDEAVRHLLRVAAGLDSLVLGEPQILGQVNRAFSQAQEQGTAGPVMRALFRAALAAGKRVRAETGIGRNPASIPSVAITQARSMLGGLQDRTVLLVGAGAMARTALKALRARGCTRIHIANRTPARARALVDGWGGTCSGLDQLEEALAAADLVFCATDTQTPLLTREMLQRVQETGPARQRLLFDLGVPRNIDPGVAELAGVSLVDMDRLTAELDDSLGARRREVPAVEAILAEEERRVQARLAQLAMRPVIAGLRQKAEVIRRREVERTMRHIGEVDPETLDHITHLSRALVNQLLHEPTQRMRQEAAGDQQDLITKTVRDLFNLDLPEEPSTL